jgi:hypothetical protein
VSVDVALPDAEPDIASQLESEAALHVQLALVRVSVTAKEPPPEGAAWVVDARL